MSSTPGEELTLLWIGGHVVPTHMVVERRFEGAVCNNGRIIPFGFGESWDNVQAPPYQLAGT
jgi:hypothetical protein